MFLFLDNLSIFPASKINIRLIVIAFSPQTFAFNMGKLSESLSNVLDFIANFNKSPRSSVEPVTSADKQNVMVSIGVTAHNQYNCNSCRIVSSLTLFTFGGMAIYQTITKTRQLSGIRRKLVMFGGGLLSFG